MKIKKILTVLILCLCSVFCLAGCTTGKGLTQEDISLAVSQATKTNKEKLYDKLTDFYNVDLSCFELNLFGYTKSLSGICLDEGHIIFKKYTNGKKVKYFDKETSSDGEIYDENYQVADYTEKGSEVFIAYDLDENYYEILESEDDFKNIIDRSLLISLIEERFVFVDNIKYEKLVDGNEVFSGIYLAELDWLAYNYIEVIFDDDKIVSINWEEFFDLDNKGSDLYNFNITYDTGDFVVDISECIPN